MPWYSPENKQRVRAPLSQARSDAFNKADVAAFIPSCPHLQQNKLVCINEFHA